MHTRMLGQRRLDIVTLVLIVLCFVTVLSSSLLVAVAQGALLYVDDDVGDDSDNCTDIHPCASVSRAIEMAVANDTIIVRDGHYSGLENCRLSILISLTLVSDGHVVFSCESAAALSVMELKGRITVNVQGLHFQHSRATVAFVGPNVTSRWTDVHFFNNSGPCVNLHEDSKSDFIGCTFKNNYMGQVASASAVLIDNGQYPLSEKDITHSFSNCSFEQNSGGTVIFIFYSILFYVEDFKFSETNQFQNCKFLNNPVTPITIMTVANDKTALSTIFLMNSCIFVNNTGTEGSGGVNIQAIISSTANVNLVTSISKTTFEGNQALKGPGGAINLTYNFMTLQARHTTEFRDCTFIRNTASQGGAIYINQAQRIIIKRCAFTDNKSFTGGAIFLEPNAWGSLIEFSNFTRNTASSSILGGGAVFICSSLISHCLFENNTALNSGGAILFYEATDLQLLESGFINNEACQGFGGAVMFSFVSFMETNTVMNCQFRQNRASLGGGAIAFDSNTLGFNISNAVFDLNEVSKGNGGALHFAESTSRVWLERSNFTRNFAAQKGGAVFLDDRAGGANMFFSSLFQFNVAQGNGSWVYPANSSIIFALFTLKNVTVESNCSPLENCSSHGSCDRDNGLCMCDQNFDSMFVSSAGNCSRCEDNWYPSGVCRNYCDSATTCNGRGTCSPMGQCICEFWMLGSDCNDTRMVLFVVFMSLLSAAVVVCMCSVGFACWQFGPRTVKTLKLAFKIYFSKQYQRSAIHQQLLLNEIDSFAYLSHTMVQVRERVNPYGWAIPAHQLQFKERIGSGAFGEVYRGMLRGTTEVAIKILRVSSLVSDDDDGASVDPFLNEIALWAGLKHPNVVQFIGACVDEGSICIVSEFMVNGTLANKLGKKVFLNWNKKIRLGIHIASAMSDLHSRDPPVLHRDLKPQNVLLDENMVGKITDFGLSKILRETEAQSQSLVGTPYWMAPEVIRGDPYGVAADIYSFGILMFQLLVDATTPFTAGDIMKTQYQVAQHGIRPTIPEISDLISMHQFIPAPKFQRNIQESPTSPFSKTPPPSPEKSSTPTPIRCAQLVGDYIELMQQCWTQQASDRPQFTNVLARLQQLMI